MCKRIRSAMDEKDCDKVYAFLILNQLPTVKNILESRAGERQM